MQEQQDTLAGYYDNYKETQQEILRIECRKTKRKLITIGFIIFFFDLLGLTMLNYVTIHAVLIISIVPIGFVLLGVLANKEPLAAMIIGAIAMLVIYILLINRIGAAMFASALFLLRTGLFVYLFIAGFQSAMEAQRLKKELKM